VTVAAAGGEANIVHAELDGLPVVTVNITALPPLGWSVRPSVKQQQWVTASWQPSSCHPGAPQ
jgi:hypothetical protein